MKKSTFILLIIFYPFCLKSVLAQAELLYDVFQLAKWNEYTFGYEYLDSYSHYIFGTTITKDSGLVKYLITDSTLNSDRIDWAVRREVDVQRKIITPSGDTIYKYQAIESFTLMEFLMDGHQLYTSLASQEKIWQFPVSGTDAVYRYITISDTLITYSQMNNEITDSLWFNSTTGMYKRIRKTLYINGKTTTETRLRVDLLGGIVSSNEIPKTPKTFILSQNYPNPFNPSTKISWQTPVSGWQTLKVYDVLGNEVATLVDEYRNAGSFEVEFKSIVGSRQLANGIYFYQLQAGNYLETKKMILLK